MAGRHCCRLRSPESAFSLSGPEHSAADLRILVFGGKAKRVQHIRLTVRGSRFATSFRRTCLRSMAALLGRLPPTLPPPSRVPIILIKFVGYLSGLTAIF